MSDPPRPPKSIPTPSGLRIQSDERDRGRDHRDYAVNRQPISRPDRDDAIPEETDWEKTPVHMSPLDQANFRAKRASSIALGKVTQVRLELKSDVGRVNTRVDTLDEKVSGKIDAIDEKVDALAAKVGTQDGKLDTLTGMLKDELDAKREDRRTIVNVDAQGRLSDIEERAKFNQVRRDLLAKLVIGVVLPLAAAITTYFFATR